jgi:hypothetical protein
MDNPFSDGMHFVEVRHDSSREIWITAGPRKEAVGNVLRHFSRGHAAELCEKRVTYEEAARFTLKNGEARVYEDPNASRGLRRR